MSGREIERLYYMRHMRRILIVAGLLVMFAVAGCGAELLDNTDTSAVSSTLTQSDESQTAAGNVKISQHLTFRSRRLLEEHYKKHGREMGFASPEEYQSAAAAVVMNSEALHKTEAEDGDDVYYIESTNEFVVVSADGYIRTYFKPDSGIRYYNRQ